jgi:hypothetical protein
VKRPSWTSQRAFIVSGYGSGIVTATAGWTWLGFAREPAGMAVQRRVFGRFEL